MTSAPHLFVRVTASCAGKENHGQSAEGLTPKWFTKNPQTSFVEEDLPEMLRVIRQAADAAIDIGSCRSFSRWWLELYERHTAWAETQETPGLLAGLGFSLVERAALDAFCRTKNRSIGAVLRSNAIELQLGELRRSLQGISITDVLPPSPPAHICVRHTVGLGDAITAADATGQRPDDGLPYTLEENIRHYGLRYLKIKISGETARDLARLEIIAELLGSLPGPSIQFTLDGNESYASAAEFRSAWQQLLDSPRLRSFFEQSLLFVEQPIHRDQALAEQVGDELRQWPDAPPLIIDESDCDLGTLPRALKLGYRGTSHKNCKGILKGVLAKATIEQHSTPSRPLILSAEDLGNIGPIALLQDLAIVATLGLVHVERNGHHYFAGLSMFEDAIQRQMLRDHSDLYQLHDRGYPKLTIDHGQLRLDSINRAAFGTHTLIDFDSLPRWEF